MVAGPGVCSSDYTQFPFRHLRRPIYPLDEEATLDRALSYEAPAALSA